VEQAHQQLELSQLQWGLLQSAGVTEPEDSHMQARWQREQRSWERYIHTSLLLRLAGWMLPQPRGIGMRLPLALRLQWLWPAVGIGIHSVQLPRLLEQAAS